MARDLCTVHRCLTPGLVIAIRLDGDAPIVTFANGMIVRELLVAMDNEARRFAYDAVGRRAAHHNASMQVFAAGAGRSRLVRITDLLTDDRTAPIGDLVEQGAAVMQETVESRAAR